MWHNSMSLRPLFSSLTQDKGQLARMPYYLISYWFGLLDEEGVLFRRIQYTYILIQMSINNMWAKYVYIRNPVRIRLRPKNRLGDLHVDCTQVCYKCDGLSMFYVGASFNLRPRRTAVFLYNARLDPRGNDE